MRRMDSEPKSVKRLLSLFLGQIAKQREGKALCHTDVAMFLQLRETDQPWLSSPVEQRGASSTVALSSPSMPITPRRRPRSLNDLMRLEAQLGISR